MARLNHEGLRLAHAYDGLVDAAEHSVDAIQLVDTCIGALALGDVVHDGKKDQAVARVDALQVDLDGILGPVFTTLIGLDDLHRALAAHERCQQ